MTASPKVSVVVALHNSARYLEQCVESLRRQTFSDFEALLVDGGSTDETPAMACRWAARDARFRFLPAERYRRVSEARAHALRACRGPYVAILDSDDFALPRRLEKQAAWMEGHPETVLLATYYRVINARGWILRYSPIHFTHDIDMRWRLTFGNCLTQSTLLFRREAAMAAGGYDPSVRAGEDMDFYSRLMSHGRLDILPEVLCVWRQHASSLSRTEPAEYKTDFLRSVQNAVRRQVGKDISLEVAAAVYNQSLQPAAGVAAFREALALTLRAYEVFLPKLFSPEIEHRLLGRAAFLQLLDLYTRNRRQPWLAEALPAWRAAMRQTALDPARYLWTRDWGLAWYYKKLLKCDWSFLLALYR